MAIPKVLVVDDEAPLRESLAYAFRKEGFEVAAAADGASGVEMARGSRADIIVLDLILPDRDGVDVCREIRTWSPVPIIMLTARDQVTDRLTGFDAGADDYLTKPFNTRELVARVRAVLHRDRNARALLADDKEVLARLERLVAEKAVAGAAGSAPLSFAGLTLAPADVGVVIAGRTVVLGPAEYRLLEMLMAEKGRVVTRTHLCSQIWGEANPRTVTLLDATVRILRQKVEENPAYPTRVVTVAGIGYQIS